MRYRLVKKEVRARVCNVSWHDLLGPLAPAAVYSVGLQGAGDTFAALAPVIGAARGAVRPGHVLGAAALRAVAVGAPLRAPQTLTGRLWGTQGRTRL